jgi:hypothetical protein
VYLSLSFSLPLPLSLPPSLRACVRTYGMRACACVRVRAYVHACVRVCRWNGDISDGLSARISGKRSWRGSLTAALNRNQHTLNKPYAPRPAPSTGKHSWRRSSLPSTDRY